MQTEYAHVKLVIKRKPPPPPLDPFVCVLCDEEIKRDPYNPEFERAPICFRCSMRAPTRPHLTHVGVDQWQKFYRAHALLYAIKQEIDLARKHNRHR